MPDLKEYSDKYLSILTNEYAGLNLTRILEPDEFYNKQILDSVIPFTELNSVRTIFENSKTIVDIGFGGGFPILPLAKLMPDKKFIGFEARGKKAKAVNDIAGLLEQTNVKCFHERVENILFNTPDTLVTFKAVGRVDKFLERLYTDKKDLRILFFKGPGYEKDEEPQALALKHWEQVLKANYVVEGADKRTAVVFKPKNVLRGTTKHKLQNLSKFL